MEQEVCKFNQRGYCKFGSECHKYHENETCEDQGCTRKACRKRHPRICKYFGDNMSCKFDKECAYTHRDNVNMKEINELTEELKNIIAELNVLKNTIKFLPEIEKEGKFM